MEDTRGNRMSDAVATRKRRSSILKNQRPPRTPLSELEFNVATPTDTTKSRRVSFSRRTDVAEFITNEATTTWKNIYVEQNKSLESSCNESLMNPSRQTVCSLGKRAMFEQQFQEEMIDLDMPAPNSRVHEMNMSLMNINFSQQIADLERQDMKFSAPQKLEMSSFTEDRSKLFGEITATMTGVSNRIEVNFSTIQPVGDKCDDLEEIERDLLRNNGAQQQLRMPFSPEGSEYIEVDLNTTHVGIKLEGSDKTIIDSIRNPVKSIPQVEAKHDSTSSKKDWTIDKENIVMNPYTAPKESSNFANKEIPDQELVYDGKKVSVQTERQVVKGNDVDYNQLLSSIDPPARILERSKRDEHSDATFMNMSITQAIPDNMLLSNTIGKTIDTANMSVTRALPINIILTEKTATAEDVNYFTITQAVADSNVILNEVQKSNTMEQIDSRQKTLDLSEKDVGDKCDDLDEIERDLLGKNAAQQSKLLGEITAHMTGVSNKIEVDFSAIQPVGDNCDDLDEIERDLLGNNAAQQLRMPFSPEGSEYIEVDLNTTHVSLKPDMTKIDSRRNSINSLPQVEANHYSTSSKKDWTADKENIAMNPYIAPKESLNFAINEIPDQVLVYDGKKISVQTERQVFNRKGNDVDYDQLTSAIEPPARILERNKRDEHSDTTFMNMSITQAIPDNMLLSNSIGKTIDAANMSVTRALPVNIIITEKSAIADDTNNFKLTQAISDSNVILNKVRKSNTMEQIDSRQKTLDLSEKEVVVADIASNNEKNQLPKLIGRKSLSKIFVGTDLSKSNMEIVTPQALHISENEHVQEKCQLLEDKLPSFCVESVESAKSTDIPLNVSQKDHKIDETNDVHMTDDKTELTHKEFNTSSNAKGIYEEEVKILNKDESYTNILETSKHEDADTFFVCRYIHQIV